ncbi:MAG: ComEA family DNA-binding protein [Firmicutes bacterium]|nr:ComEA family DNA-binding protein [Bacillota bacterium]
MKSKIFGGIVLFLLAFGFIIYQNKSAKVVQDNDNIFAEETYNNNTNIAQNEKKIIVCITGEILHPGSYEMLQGSRVKDLVDTAGGFTEYAETSRLNLARKLVDEDLVVIPAKVLVQNGDSNNANGANIDPKAVVPNQNASGKINLNTATASELTTIPGIGKVTAEKIIKYREEKGFFSKLEQLMEVDRIGEATFNKIKDYVEIY